MSLLHPDTRRRLAPVLQRVLIVDAGAHPASLLAGCLSVHGCRQAVIETHPEAALATAEILNPTLIFTEAFGDDDPFALIRTLRRSVLDCRQAPIVVLTTLATDSAVQLAKASGAHDFLRKPFSPRELVRHLEALAQHPRPWVEKSAYAGPDRRFFNTGAAVRRLSDRMELIGQGVSASSLYLAP